MEEFYEILAVELWNLQVLESYGFDGDSNDMLFNSKPQIRSYLYVPYAEFIQIVKRVEHEGNS